MLSFLQTPTPQALLFGKEAHPTSHELVADLAEAGVAVHVLDGVGMFNVFRIAEEARLSEFHVLHRIFVQRAFSPFQILDTIGEWIERHKEIEVKSRFYVFLNPSKQFFDGDVKQEDREYLLPILAKQFQTLRSLGFRFAISESKQWDRPEYQKFFQSLQREGVHYVLDCRKSLLPANEPMADLFLAS